MRKNRLKEQIQDKLIEHFVAGTTARCAAELIGINRKTAGYYFHRLREIIAYQLDQESQDVFEGEIEVDESYFGGARKGQTRPWSGWQDTCLWPLKARWACVYKNHS